MAEATEYTLAVLISTLLVGGSAAAYAAFARFETSSEADSSLSALVALANEAALVGHASSTLLLPTSSVTCSNGVMSLALGNATVSAAMHLSCDFAATIPGGLHNVTFDYGSAGLILQVN